MKKIPWFIIILLLLFSCSHYHVDEPEITSEELYSHINFLASDSIKGRKPGTKGDIESAEYIRDQFKGLGLKLLANEGFQEFELVTSVKMGDNNSFSFHGVKAEPETDFVPLAMSENASIEADICFAGYGFNINDENIHWNDYKDIEAEGKWLMILTADPEAENSKSKFSIYSDQRSKIILARDKKAAGVIFVDGANVNPEDKLDFVDIKEASSGLPVVQIKRVFANTLLKTKNLTIEEIESRLINNHKPFSFDLGSNASITTDLELSKVKTMNVIACLPGNEKELRDEYIVIGGHYDHLGMGGQGSGSRATEVIAVHNGADDNASGVASIIEIAERMVYYNEEFKRSIIFVAFGAEEPGLIGSKYFVDNPPVNISSIKTMVNIDMVGRLREDNSLQIGGTGSAAETEDLLKKNNEEYHFKLAFSSAGYGPSDHASFYGKDIPVMFFSTGAHLDYHTPDDDIDRINIDGLVSVGNYISDICMIIAKKDSALSFREAGPRTATNAGQGFKVTLGIMPDFVSSEINGLRIDFVTVGKPAHGGGIMKGDIITAINGMSINNIYDYMARLSKLKAGETITVEVLRNNKKEVLLVQL